MKYFLIFGPPGAGKGTQSTLIARRYNFRHISTGELLRNEIAVKSDIGKIAAVLIEKGEFVPDELVIGIVRKEICNPGGGEKGYILDGFPRNTYQAIALDKMLEETGYKVDAVLSLETTDSVNIKRIQHRANIEGRKDDADFETIRNRIKTYHKVTEPLVNYYKKQSKYMAVDGDQSIEENFVDICKIIDKKLDE
ncbi:MAG: adenylate kinase [Bacteroidales bacterium]|jgi:adenylate kinase|nr:adenylate kinase [Bacteroidales bacterium]MDD4057379.1 adenylate kinase [Bacteroidales bacterium]